MFIFLLKRDQNGSWVVELTAGAPSPCPFAAVGVSRQFSFLLGTDTYQDLRKGKWRKSAELMKMVSVVIVDSEWFFFSSAL